ncbi:shikimate dehydrogenase [Coleofasciculus sp. FACHB-1120]|uniref:shikimate dehydrogenase n=1 Tax=Coleofasciculus sp. FACHB-1120 TaxID=2692783 RepID=UPI001689A56A|nr:shikimate dehydrogenase [Coleofasciculus sp. FACHB-1120]MBD2742806.1 shikimate dehydrogenase [Coleofasciculus sp. FACHB-1120]
MIQGTTKLLGVIGHPIGHSLSPVMHNAAIAHLGLDYVYVPLSVAPEDLEKAIPGLAAMDNFVGFSVTIPHKQAIIPLLSEVSDIAQAIGAVNTVTKTDRGWVGTNTDVTGFLAPLEANNSDWSQSVAVILGNGGAARAVVAGCKKLGCAQIHVVGRNWENLTAFQNSWRNSSLPVEISTHSWGELPSLISQASLLVNTTPVGMYPKVDESPLNAEAIANLPEGAIAYDLIYKPHPTRFLQQAQKQGAVMVNGLEMLVQQGAAALKIWLNAEPPVDVMRQSLQKQLKIKN